MSKLEKLVASLLGDSSDHTFADLKKVLLEFGFYEDRSKGSHHVFKHLDGCRQVLPKNMRRKSKGHTSVKPSAFSTSRNGMNSKNPTRDKPLSFYLNRHYPTTFYPDDEGGFTVMIDDLPGCMTQGDTAEEAFEMIAEAKELWIESAYDDGCPIPPPSTETAYSGKTMLRMPKYLHARLAANARREGISLNQYIVALLSERDALIALKATFKDTVKDTVTVVIQHELSAIREQLEKKERSPYLVKEAFTTTPSKPSSDLSN